MTKVQIDTGAKVIANSASPLSPDGDARFEFLDTLILELWQGRAIRRVLLVNPPDGDAALFRKDTALRKRYANYPPYGNLCLASHLRKIGIEVSILNLNDIVLKECRESPGDFDFDGSWRSSLEASIEQFAPDLVGITCMFTMTHQSFKRVCAVIGEGDIPIALGGVHVTNDWQAVMEDIPAASFAFLREGELSFAKFCQYVNGKVSRDGICQLVARDVTKNISVEFDGEALPQNEDLNLIPSYDLIDLGDLSENGVMGNFYGFKEPETKFATMLSNRGCRAQCTFCSVRTFNGVGVRQRSIDSVIEEMKILRFEHGIDHVVWLDDDLLKGNARSLELFNRMVRENLGLTWDATNGVIAASCKDEMVAAMEASGCIALNIGMESGNPDVLRKIKKPGTPEVFIRAAEVLKRHPSIHSRVFLMIGFPDETLSMIGDTIQVAREMDLDWCSITTLQPLPNTPIYNSMVEQGLIDDSSRGETRFNSGGFGKQNEIDRGERLASQSFEEAFSFAAPDQIPSHQNLNDIWFFMNYHLNFHRLFSEDREFKLREQLMNMNTLSDVISPEHGFALYFKGYIESRLEGRAAGKTINRLAAQLEKSSFWADRLSTFGLDISDLELNNYKNKKIPRFMPFEFGKTI